MSKFAQFPSTAVHATWQLRPVETHRRTRHQTDKSRRPLATKSKRAPSSKAGEVVRLRPEDTRSIVMKVSRLAVPTVPIELLRAAIARHGARFSLRRIARDIPMSPNGLRNFLNGAAPRATTRAKLERWLASQTTMTRSPDLGQFVRLVNHLSRDLHPRQAVRLGSDILTVLVGAYEERRLAPPGWVQELARHYRPARKAAHEIP